MKATTRHNLVVYPHRTISLCLFSFIHVATTIWLHVITLFDLHRILSMVSLILAIVVRREGAPISSSLLWSSQLTGTSGFLLLAMSQFAAFHIKLVSRVRMCVSTAFWCSISTSSSFRRISRQSKISILMQEKAVNMTWEQHAIVSRSAENEKLLVGEFRCSKAGPAQSISIVSICCWR